MAFTAAVEWDVRVSGSDSNGGGFAVGSGGTDYSQQDNPAIVFSAIDYLAIDAVDATKCTSNGVPFDSTHVGNIINVTGGTGFTVQRVQILSVAAGVATCDKSLGTLGSTGGTGNLGGALLSPAVPCGLTVGGNTVWIKSGTYNITVDSNNVAGGKLVPSGTGSPANGPVAVVGYGATHGDMGTRPLLQSNGSITGTLVTLGSCEWLINVELDGGGAGSLAAVSGSAGISYKVKASNFAGSTTFSGACILCEAVAATAVGFTVSNDRFVDGCVARGCATGFSSTANKVTNCIASGNSGAGFSISASSSSVAGIVNCVAYDNGTYGFQLSAAASAPQVLTNCIATGNDGYQFGASSTMAAYLMLNCAAKADGSGAFDPNLSNPATLPKRINCITLTADPFVNAAGGNFALNGVAGGGDACKRAGLLGAFPGSPTINTTGFQDIGAVQSQLLVAASVGATGVTGPAPSTNLIFAGVMKRWNDHGLDAYITGSLTQNEATSGTAMPYAVLEAVSDVPDGRSNRVKYRKVGFQITVVTATPEEGGDLAGRIMAAMEQGPLEPGGADAGASGNLIELWEGATRYLWNRDRTKLFTVLEFMANFARPR